MKKIPQIFLVNFLLLIAFSSFANNIKEATHFGECNSTPTMVDFIGYVTIDGQEAAIGDEAAVFDDQDRLVGCLIITTPGQYGVLHVYGDDPTTDSHDGATVNSLLTFKIWQKSSQTEIVITENMMSSQLLGSYEASNIPPYWPSDRDAFVLNIAALSPIPPVARVDDKTVEEGALVTLDCSLSSDVDDVIVSYLWTQDLGNSVTLSDTEASRPTFTAPNVENDGELLIFRLTVTDGTGLQDSDTCRITINKYHKQLSVIWPGLTLLSLRSSFRENGLSASCLLNALINQNIQVDKIQTYLAGQGMWKTLGTSGGEDFDFPSGTSWLVYTTQSEPATVDLDFPINGTVREVDVHAAINMLNYNALSYFLDIGNNQTTWTENFFERFNQKSGKAAKAFTTYDPQRGSWRATYQFFTKLAGNKSITKNEGYIANVQEGH